MPQSPIVVNVILPGKQTLRADFLARIETATREAVERALAVGIGSRPSLFGTSAQGAGIAYFDYCTNDALDIDRPFGNVLNEHTFRCEERLLRQAARAGVPLDPPDGAAFMAWVGRHPKGRAGLDGQRLAYARLIGYYGLYIPPIMKRSWDSKRAIDRALHEGKPLRRFNRHLRNGPLDVIKLLDARPFKDAHMNEQFRHVVTLLCITGPRSSEPRDLRLSNVRADQMRIVDWWQEKKDEHRTIFVPERWFWQGGDTSVQHFLDSIRPRFAPRAADDAYFLNSEGAGYATANAWRTRTRIAISNVLGYPVGPHTFRRFCATMRYIYDWSEEQIAEFLHDTPEVVRSSYIDYDLARRVGRRHLRRSPNERPELPPFAEMARDLCLV